ncbi:MAG: prepilin-type N-terminal cleavage/methylation domain-containing protein [Patescibacteria group bacterium]
MNPVRGKILYKSADLLFANRTSNGMKWARAFQSGYSIVEIMIVLAISGVIFTSGLVLFSGQGAEVNFNQAVDDLASKLSTEARSVSASQFYSAQGFVCTVSGSPPRATLSPSSDGSGATNQDCLSIGKVFEAITGTNDIFIYNVLGNRQIYSGGTPLGPASSLAEANPTIAVADGIDLNTDYKLGGGLKIISSKVADSAGILSPSSLVGYYLDFSGESGNSQSGGIFTAKAYNLDTAGHDVSAAKTCVEGTSCSVPSDINSWQLCLESSDTKRRALLVVSNSAAGVTTNLKFESCS